MSQQHEEKSDKLKQLKFDNSSLRELPIDKETNNYTRTVKNACFSLVKPTPLRNPQLVAHSLPALALLDLTDDDIKNPDFKEYFCGNKILPGSETASHCYCGHQFGAFSGQLGDGAAIYLGEIINSKGERVELQLKGAGKTPYSRSADGRKVLRSSIREFLCSEAIHSLNIPSTRAATVITSDDKVVRDVFYTGDPIQERASVVSRLAPTFLRFGSFEIFKPTDDYTGRTGPSVGNTELLHQMLNFTIGNYFPDIAARFPSSEQQQDKYLAFYEEVTRRTARLVAHWQCVGWCHGVLNTDNMSIIGVTLDYGPYGFLDRYDPDFICNGSDDTGRYAFGRQPEICKWNCVKLGEAISEALPLDVSQSRIHIFDEEYDSTYYGQMRKKLGFVRQGKKEEEDKKLIDDLTSLMAKTGSDMTNTFRGLNKMPLFEKENQEEAKQDFEQVLEYMVSMCSNLDSMKLAFRPRIPPGKLKMLMDLARQDPMILFQLGAGPELIQREMEQYRKLEALNGLDQDGKVKRDREMWREWLGKYRERLNREGQDLPASDRQRAEEERLSTMNQANPRVVLRNYMAQIAIERAEKGDFSEVQRLLRVLSVPFAEADPADEPARFDANYEQKYPPGAQDADREVAEDNGTDVGTCQLRYVIPKKVGPRKDDDLPPDWAGQLRVTCSS